MPVVFVEVIWFFNFFSYVSKAKLTEGRLL